MKISQRNSEWGAFCAGRINGVLLCSLVAFVGLLIFLAWQSLPSKVVAKKQADLIAGIEKRNPGRIKRLLADGYSDRWGFDREDAVVAIVDVGSQFLTLVVTESEKETVIEGKEAKITAMVTCGGKPVGPAGQEAIKRLNRLEEPFVFTWRKESFLPASWRLVRIENAGLPDELWGYEPGDIGRMMQGEVDL